MVTNIELVTILVSGVDFLISTLLLIAGLSLGGFTALVLVQLKVFEGHTIIETNDKWATLKQFTR